MKASFGILVICAFIGMAVFGAFAMSHTMGELDCLARTAAGGNACPGVAGTAGIAAFHLNLLKSFSAASIIAWVGLFLLVLMALGSVPPENFTSSLAARFSLVHRMHAIRQCTPRFSRWISLRARRIPPLS